MATERQLLFEELVTRHMDAVYAFALALTRSPVEAEDLVQTAFLKAYRSFGTFAAGSSFKAWVLRIVRNAHIDALRASGARPMRLLAFEAGEGEGDEPAAPLREAPSLDIESREIFFDLFGDEVNALLKALPEGWALAVLLCDVEGLSYAEIADLLDCPVGTVRSRIHRARARLREGLSEHARRLGYRRERKGEAP